MQPDGSYIQRDGEGPNSQQLFIDWADDRHRDATRLKRRRPKGLGDKSHSLGD
jgi:hypothetical protein